MATRVVVELTADQERLLRAFNQAEAADREMRAGFEKTGEAGESSAKLVADAWIKAGKQTNTSLDAMFANMRRGGGEVKELGSHLAKIAAGFESSGREASEAFLAEIEKINPELANKGKIFLQGIDEADKADKFESTRRQLEALGGDFSKLAGHIKKSTANPLDDANVYAKQLVDELLKIDPTKAQQIARALNEAADAGNAEKFEATRRQLQELGGDYAKLATEIKKSTAVPLGDAKGQAKALVDELLRIDPTKAQQIARALDDASDAIESAKVDQLVSQLAKGSEEARQLAALLGDSMKDASLKAEGGIDGIIAKITSLSPSLKASVDQWRSDMAEAAKFGEGKYKEALDALRAGDPLSKRVAEEIKKNLVASGQIVEKQFEDMLAPLRKIDPLLAEQAMKSRAHFEDLEKRHTGIFSRMSKSAVGQIAQVAAAYFGVQEAIQAVTTAIQEQQDALIDAADAHKTLATAQQDARKNLRALGQGEIRELLEGFVPQVAKETSFPDLANLTKAIGDAKSAGGTVEQVKEAVTAAASITGLTTDLVDETAAALIDVANATKNLNAKENASQLFLVGGQARVVDPQKLFRNVAPAMFAGSTLAGPGREQEAALQAAALFATLTQTGADPQGDASQTADIQLMARMSEFFKNLGKDATAARRELSTKKMEDPLSAQQRLSFQDLSNREARKEQTDKRIAQLTSQIDQLQARQEENRFGSAEEKRQVGIQKQKLDEELRNVRRSEFTATEQAKLEDLRRRIGDVDRTFQEEVAILEGRIAAENVKGFKGRLPVTPKEQVDAFVRDKNLRDAFFKDAFGEQRFRQGYVSTLSGGNAYKHFVDTVAMLESNQGSTRLFDLQVQEDRYGTRANEIAFLQRQHETNIALKDSFDTVGASLGDFRVELSDVLKKNRSPGVVASTFQAIGELGVPTGAMLRGSEGAEEITSGIMRLEDRIYQLSLGGVTPLEKERIESLERGVENALSRAGTPSTIAATSPEMFSDLLLEIRNSRAFLNRFGPEGKGFQETLLRLEAIFEENLRVQEEAAKSAKETAENTRATRRPATTDAMPRAAAAAGGRARP